ncbi:DUF4263 domain-containing protein [bacterium]|nr:DUF4263 domain-containing protein [bacterium]
MEKELLDLKQEYIKLLEKNENESIYQKFLEEHPILIPTKPFELNHFVHFSLIFKKLQLGTSHISDFCFLSKSSAEWNIVFIELEKPDSKFFNNDGTITRDLNVGISQIQDWNAYFSIEENKLAFKQNKVIKELMSFNPNFFHNPCNFKYILVIGRRETLYNSKFKDKFRSIFPRNSYIMTYDSLYEALDKKNDNYICHIENDELYIDSTKYVNDVMFHWLSCNNIRIKEQLYLELEKRNTPYNKNNFIETQTKLSPEKLELIKKNIFK